MKAVSSLALSLVMTSKVPDGGGDLASFKHLERLRYFLGRLLGSDDFRDEQRYHLDRMRRHNRYLHGWGAVNGLEVGAESADSVSITPGLAIDCAGNEVVVTEMQRVPVVPKHGTQYVGILYVEEETHPVPMHDGSAAPGRVRESSQVVVVDEDPCADHRGMGPGTPGCGVLHAVCIASITPQRGGWKIRHHGRRGS